MIKDHITDGAHLGVEVNYVTESSPLGTAGALGLIEDKIENDLIVVNGDLLTTLDFRDMLAFHTKKQSDITVGVKTINNTIPYGVIKQDEGKIYHLLEKPTDNYLINAGIYVISPSILKKIRPEPMDMPELISDIISKKGNVIAFPIHEYWIDIGEKDKLEKARIDHS